MLTIVNDLHIGAIRSAGTTPTSQWALRQYLLKMLDYALPESGDLLINGDLFDTSNIPISDVLRTYESLGDWLHDHPTSAIYNSGGNHDFAKTSTSLSSFCFLGKLLSRNFPDRYAHIEVPTMTPHGYVIPHMLNQAAFDEALTKVPACDYVFLHANFDNLFAQHSDQSLNVSKEQAETLPCKHVIFGHEHHGRRLGKVLIPGNQFASSVSDWLSSGDKYLTVIHNGNVDFSKTSTRTTQFAELDWRNLEVTDHKFVRVIGESSQEETHEVVNAISTFRRQSGAFVITNAVQVLSADGLASVDFEATLEKARGFDVIKCLLETLDADERAVVEGLV